MFEQLFGSKTRVKLIRLFIDNPEKRFYVRELTRLTDSLINSVRRELENLVDLKLVVIEQRIPETKRKENEEVKKKTFNTKKFYRLNPKNIFYQDLQKLFSKGKILIEKKLIEKIKRLGDVNYISLGGVFVEDEKAASDLLIISNIEKQKIIQLISKFEKDIAAPLNYTIMNDSEYELRRDICDRFLLDIIENENNVVYVDKLVKKK